MNLWETYSSVLKDKTPESFNEAPGMDVPWYWKELEEGHPNDKFPGLKTLKANMKAFNEPRQPLDRRPHGDHRSAGEPRAAARRRAGLRAHHAAARSCAAHLDAARKPVEVAGGAGLTRA